MDNEMNTVQIPAEKLVDALLHAKQFEHHYATQESVDNLKESVNQRFEQVDKRLDEIKSESAKRFDKLESKSDRFQWFITTLILGIFFKDQIFSLFM